METPQLIMVGVALVVVAAGFGYLAGRRSHAGVPGAAHPLTGSVQAAIGAALADIRHEATDERDRAIRAALEQSAVLQREHLGAKHEVMNSRLDLVQGELRADLSQVMATVRQLAERSAHAFGKVDQSLQSHAETTRHLAASAQALKAAMASPTTRGQWGERMAEDVLRVAGMIENVNYVKQAQIDGGSGRPDFTFSLPKGQELYMDVKFPMSAYLRYVEADAETERSAHRAAFLRDVKLRVNELAKRDYARSSAGEAISNVLLFLPNEQLAGFIYEADPTLIDEAMKQGVVLCSPMTLFALLGVLRQANDNFMIEQTSNEMLSVLGVFATEFDKYGATLDKLAKKFSQLHNEFDAINGVRRRQLERPVRQLDQIRADRGVPLRYSDVHEPDQPTADSGVPTSGQRRLQSSPHG